MKKREKIGYSVFTVLIVVFVAVVIYNLGVGEQVKMGPSCLSAICSYYPNEIACSDDICGIKKCRWDSGEGCEERVYQMDATIVKEKSSDTLHMFYEDTYSKNIANWLNRIEIYHEISYNKGNSWIRIDSSDINYPTSPWGARYDETATVLSDGKIVLTYALASCDRTIDAAKTISMSSNDNGITWNEPSDILVFEGNGKCGYESHCEGNTLVIDDPNILRGATGDQIIETLNDGSLLEMEGYGVNEQYPNKPSDDLGWAYTRPKGISSARSSDGGATWTNKVIYDESYFTNPIYQRWPNTGRVIIPYVSSIVQDPISGNVYFGVAATITEPYWQPDAVLYTSTDNGFTWNFNNPEVIGTPTIKNEAPNLFFYNGKVYATVEGGDDSGITLSLFYRKG